MPDDLISGPFARKQRTALVIFYISCFVFAFAVSGGLSSSYRLIALSIAVLAAAGGAYSLYSFFKTTDEFRQGINRRAIEFAFIGSLIAAVVLALLHSFGVRDVSPYVIPALMVILWSVGLFFASRRFE